MLPSGFIRHFTACNRHDLSHFAPLVIEGTDYGFVHRAHADLLPADLFSVVGGKMALAPHLTDFAARSGALARAVEKLAAHYGKALRHEPYAVVDKWGGEPVARIDRAGVPWFGFRAWGTHVNGYVRKPEGLYLWVGERAASRPADPGKLDHIVGGGLPFGLSMEENLCKEAHEEAGIGVELAKTARLARTLSYRLERPDGMRNDTLLIYDLELPPDFTPRNTDGEVAAFHLMPAADVARLVRDTDKFKFNCNLVIADFLMRHGVIGPDDPEHAALTRYLSAKNIRD